MFIDTNRDLHHTLLPISNSVLYHQRICFGRKALLAVEPCSLLPGPFGQDLKNNKVKQNLEIESKNVLQKSVTFFQVPREFLKFFRGEKVLFCFFKFFGPW